MTHAVTEPDPLTRVALARKSGHLVVIANSTPTPGLVVAPEVGDDGRMTGDFAVIHEASGYHVPIGRWGGVDVNTAFRVAEALGTTPIDWTADKESLALQVNNTIDVVRAAINAGKYPQPAPDDDETPAYGGPGEYPSSSAQTTAHTLAAHYVSTALRKTVDMWELMKYERSDDAARRRHIEHVVCMISEYGVVSLLRRFHDVDPVAADAAARDLWEAADAGDSFGEWLSEWGAEYGVPTPTEGSAEGYGVSQPNYEAWRTSLLDAKLMYGETVDELRRRAADYAKEGEDRFGVLVAKMADDPDNFTAEDNRDMRLAHAAALFGWFTASLFGLLREKFPALAVEVGNMLSDMGTNGGAPHTDDLVSVGAAGEIVLTENPADPATP